MCEHEEVDDVLDLAMGLIGTGPKFNPKHEPLVKPLPDDEQDEEYDNDE